MNHRVLPTPEGPPIKLTLDLGNQPSVLPPVMKDIGAKMKSLALPCTLGFLNLVGLCVSTAVAAVAEFLSRTFFPFMIKKDGSSGGFSNSNVSGSMRCSTACLKCGAASS